MKKTNYFIALFLLLSSALFAQVSINNDNSTPDNSAMLDVKSTTKGALLPRMTTAERVAIAAPAAGLTVYDLTTQGYWYYNGTAWVTIANSPWTQNGNDIYANIFGKAGIGTNVPDDKLHLYDSVNLRILIETPDNFYAGVRTRNSQREYFMGTIGDRWSVFDNYVGGDRISVLPNGNVGIGNTAPTHRLMVSDPSGNNTLRLTGTGATYGEGSKLNFGDGDYVFISEDINNNLLIKGAQRTAIMGGNVGIATTTPEPSAALDVSSTSKGFLPPRMTHFDRIFISNPAAGLIVWCLDCGPNGELQVFNGTAWTNMIGGTPAAGVLVGKSYQGGIIAYVLAPGDPGYVAGEFHGLIAAPFDQTMALWGCYPNALPGADGTALGTGNQNTIDIKTYCYQSDIAADRCGDLELNGYSDWYLPSKDELNMLYINRLAIGNFGAGWFWSSSESSSINAWAHNFTSNTQFSTRKDYTFNVRAIRAF